jgi:hypothetical protein
MTSRESPRDYFNNDAEGGAVADAAELADLVRVLDRPFR